MLCYCHIGLFNIILREKLSLDRTTTKKNFHRRIKVPMIVRIEKRMNTRFTDSNYEILKFIDELLSFSSTKTCSCMFKHLDLEVPSLTNILRSIYECLIIYANVSSFYWINHQVEVLQ